MARDKALLVVVKWKRGHGRSIEAMTAELRELVRSAGGEIVGEVFASVERPSPGSYVASGKLAEIRARAKTSGANVTIFNIELTPVQARNIESAAGTRAVDRTGLILDIFARRAQSRAGRLQVELAQLNYLLPRLAGQGVILSRLGGGIGTRGPGEQKLEVDRRKIRARIQRIQGEIEKLRQHRGLIRKRRKRLSLRSAALVGVTNAGKSTLLNALTGAKVFVEDKMFATLDPTTRAAGGGRRPAILLTDTVGFLSGLPHFLVEAFHATLEEAEEADVLIHVLDGSSPAVDSDYETAVKTLEGLKIGRKPVVLAINKADLLSPEEQTRMAQRFPDGILISAKQKTGLDRLLEEVTKCMECKDP